ncbi:MAG: signal recognition particle protein Srp19 [Thermoproteota archaeon]|nr:MAG: signal recognition particle protein Srp19 [Candidatus Korarchaeota archaeon]RLG54531.1 MAG: signal recognition particle protein Srp19 [Candidatus Korarchaeota archaeon]
MVLYPCYFNRSLSRSEGRRVPLSLAVKNPSAESIFRAAEKLGLDPVLQKDKHHPARWFYREGRVLVKKIDRKTKVIRAIAEELKRS